MTNSAASYDEVPYKSYAFAQSHPMRLGAMATLFGMNPKPVDRCRVLELGCAAGGNIIPMAEMFPGSEFVGIDLSRRQIEDGQALLKELPLQNCQLLHKSITDIDAGFGQFDYIITHGVFSWVPDLVQDAMLRICKENLSEHGVAYISYNTYPGWHMRGMIRDLMVYRAKSFETAEEKLAQARALLHFLAEVTPRRDPYGLFLKEEARHIDQCDDYYLFHEYLEEHNTPLYFYQFMDKASLHRLQYLGETNFAEMLVSNFPKEVADALLALTDDIVCMEQYMDFVRNRYFRQTLLVHDHLQLDRDLSTNHNIRKLFFRMKGAPEHLPEKLDDTPLAFRTSQGGVFTTADPLAKAALLALFDTAKAFSFKALIEAAQSYHDQSLTERDLDNLEKALLGAYGVNVIECLTIAPPIQTEPGDRPQALASTRKQAEKGHMPPSLWHEPMVSDRLGLAILALCDGEHDQAKILQALIEQVQAGCFTIADDNNQPIRNAEILRPMLSQALDTILPALARMGMFKLP